MAAPPPATARAALAGGQFAGGDAESQLLLPRGAGEQRREAPSSCRECSAAKPPRRWSGAALAAAGLLVVLAVGGATLRARRGLEVSTASHIVGLEESAESRLTPLATTIQATFRPVATKQRGSFSAECHMQEEERCPVSRMARGNITAVYPGFPTRCLLEQSLPFIFQVIPGDVDKLVVQFDLGGSCWDEATTNLALCLTNVAEVAQQGIFSLNNSANPFANHTFLIVGYCSGDAHAGTVDRDWVVPAAGNVSQRGYWNAKAAVDWARDNFGDRRLKSLIVSGSSAGSLGAQLWARTILGSFKYQAAAVIADSFVGVFPPGVQGPVERDAGLCLTPLLSEAMQVSCQAGMLDVQTVFEDTMRNFPEVTFASIDSKVDIVQMAYYEVIHMTLLKRMDYTLTPETFSAALAALYRRYNEQPNWVSFMVNGKNHMFLPKDILYRTRPGSTSMRTSGLFGAGLSLAGLKLTGRDTPLVEWLGTLPVRPGGSARSECRGVLPHVASAPRLGGLGTLATLMSSALSPLAQEGAELTGVGHCDPGQDDKTFFRPAKHPKHRKHG